MFTNHRLVEVVAVERTRKCRCVHVPYTRICICRIIRVRARTATSISSLSNASKCVISRACSEFIHIGRAFVRLLENRQNVIYDFSFFLVRKACSTTQSWIRRDTRVSLPERRDFSMAVDLVMMWQWRRRSKSFSLEGCIGNLLA